MGDKVLLADDSATIQKLVEMALSDSGYELLAVSDGKQAVDQLASFQPDIVLADAIMPLMDGYQVCQHVKQDSRFANVPVVLLTGRFQPFDSARAEEVGIDDRVVKPFSQEQLVSIIEKLLATRKEANAVDAAAVDSAAVDAATEDEAAVDMTLDTPTAPEPESDMATSETTTVEDDVINTVVMDDQDENPDVIPAANETVAYSPDMLEAMAREGAEEPVMEELPTIDDFEVDDDSQEITAVDDDDDVDEIDDVTMELTTEDLADLDVEDLQAEAPSEPPPVASETSLTDAAESELELEEELPEIEPLHGASDFSADDLDVEGGAPLVVDNDDRDAIMVNEEELDPAEPVDLLDDTDEMLVPEGVPEPLSETDMEAETLDTAPVETSGSGHDLDTEPVDTLGTDDLLEEPFPVEDAPDTGPEIPTEELDGPILEELEDDLADTGETPEEEVPVPVSGSPASLSEDQLNILADKVAERLITRLGEDQVREVVWEVVPELAEAMVKKRIYQLEQATED